MNLRRSSAALSRPADAVLAQGHPLVVTIRPRSLDGVQPVVPAARDGDTGRQKPAGAAPAMTSRRAYRPLRPEFDNFLFALVGAERDGIQLSVVSALTRRGLDPWEEAGRLSSLSTGEAVEQLARLIAELPGGCRPLAEARELAGDLIERLPKHDTDSPAPLVQERVGYRRPTVPGQSRYWVILAFAAALAIGIILYGGFPFGGGSP